jgi:hypothetical protein
VAARAAPTRRRAAARAAGAGRCSPGTAAFCFVRVSGCTTSLRASRVGGCGVDGAVPRARPIQSRSGVCVL